MARLRRSIVPATIIKHLGWVRSFSTLLREKGISCDLFIWKIVRTPPRHMRTEAVKSYFQTKVSPRSLIEKKQLLRIEIELVDANRLISAKGSIRV
jgi:hypothetical protein